MINIFLSFFYVPLLLLILIAIIACAFFCSSFIYKRQHVYISSVCFVLLLLYPNVVTSRDICRYHYACSLTKGANVDIEEERIIIKYMSHICVFALRLDSYWYAYFVSSIIFFCAHHFSFCS